MKRSVQPEILDALPEYHPDAVANRRDLRLINGIMGNFRWFCRTLPRHLKPTDRVLEIGAGTGELGLALHKSRGNNGAGYCGLDLWSRPPDWPGHWEWIRDDLLAFGRYSEYNVIIANLILHQFTDADLVRLGEKLRSGLTRLIVANEPARRKLHQHQLKWLRPLGLHPISRHDGHVSVAGGFQKDELPARLGLVEPDWTIRIRSGFLGWHRMIAMRTEEPSS